MLTQADKDLAMDMARFYGDPYAFVMYAFPWGKPGLLAKHPGPDTWQRAFLIELGAEVYGGGGAPTSIIYGLLRFGAVSLKPITQLFPSLILMKADQARTLALHTTLQLLTSEMAEHAPGSEVAANRLAEVLFIQTLRAHIASGSEGCKRGWLRGIFDQ